jgi:hypothetical protein
MMFGVVAAAVPGGRTSKTAGEDTGSYNVYGLCTKSGLR